MNKVTVMSPKEPVSLTGSSTTTKNRISGADFKNLLSDVMQGSKAPATKAKEPSRKDLAPSRNDDYSKRANKNDQSGTVGKNANSAVREKNVDIDDEVEAVALDGTASGLAHQWVMDTTQIIEQTPEALGEESAVNTSVVNMSATQIPAYTEVQAEGIPMEQIIPPVRQQPRPAHIQLPELAQQAEGNEGGTDILGAETITLPEQAGIVGTQRQDSFSPQFNANQQRFDDMVYKAQQQLQAITTQSETPEIPEELAPDVILNQETPLSSTPIDTESPAGAEAEPAAQAEVDAKPVSVPRTTVQSQASQMPTLQKPLKEIPKSDESIIAMQETQLTAPKEPQPVQEIVRTETPEQTQRPDVRTDQTEQIRTQVTQNLERNKMVFQMQLQPQELGKINVKLVLEGGRLAVEIMASDPISAQLLSRQSEALAQSLRTSNFDVQSIHVIDGSQATSHHMDSAFNMMNGQAQNGDNTNNSAAQNSFQGRRTQDNNSNEGSVHQDQGGSTDEMDEPKTLLNYKI